MAASVVHDPAFHRSRKEAIWILLAWAACLVWTIGFSALTGYRSDPENIHLILGFPAWIFWGVAIPWLVATAFSIWFALHVMTDEDLGRDMDKENGGL